jgi:hypothetical protein
MSTVDPDARTARIGSVLRPVALVGLVIGVLCGPAIAIFDRLVLLCTQSPPVVFLLDVVVANEQTTATLTAAGIDGMVNYVQHQRLTLKFTDDKGVDRWVHGGVPAATIRSVTRY